ncbi:MULTISPECIES: DUF1906 domain-containing protein [Streptomyces]|uniref:DUF1906 domain-containing protein n=1 Tax=Streptomyces TaxID=1883 RepID=UPI001E28C2EE|nr:MULTISPECIES: DUF1906 domain-containing protein [Streptomyces]UFQ16749.1 DUF1906 domain-containing protein [Streptomyces huasconensis]WCL86350.1 DUF1906 domain-containing protein [Streptomyces sp. JCM 35825]
MRHQKMIIGLVLALATLTVDLTASPPGASAAPAPTRAAPDPAGAVEEYGGFPASGATGSVTGATARPVRLPAGVPRFRGRAFDTCIAPSVDTMRRWRSSQYRAVGVYFAGRGRACKNQPHLSRSWVRSVHRLGWRVLPLYVGSQSPCVFAKNKKGVPIGRNPWSQGQREARDAVREAKAVGFRTRSPLYLDMEAYAYRNASCARTTLSFVRAWDREVRRSGYVPGFYSSADSGVRHMELSRRAGVRDLPSVMWFARWRTRPHLYREPSLSRYGWTPARRIHQYAGNVKERHGGRTLLIDRNLVHAPVARVG